MRYQGEIRRDRDLPSKVAVGDALGFGSREGTESAVELGLLVVVITHSAERFEEEDGDYDSSIAARFRKEPRGTESIDIS